jgi:ribosome-associated protein
MSISQKEKIRVSLMAADDKKAEETLVLDLKKLSSVTDYFIITSGHSDTQVRAIADNITAQLFEKGIKPMGTEGYRDGSWILLDYADFVIHIFHIEKRAFYTLEDLWGDAPHMTLKDFNGKKK